MSRSWWGEWNGETSSAADLIRDRLSAVIFQRVAGPQGPARRRLIHDVPGERWFADDRGGRGGVLVPAGRQRRSQRMRDVAAMASP
jgi:hypothetical protein